MAFDSDHFSPEVYDARDAEFFFEYGRAPWRRWDLFRYIEQKFIILMEPAYLKKLVHVAEKVAVPNETAAFEFVLTLTDEELVEAHFNIDDQVPTWITDIIKTAVGHRLTECSLRLGEGGPL
jgi:hypothetical protein